MRPPNILLAMATTPDSSAEEAHRTIAPLVGPDDERVFTDSGIEIQSLYEEGDVAPGLEARLEEAARAAEVLGVATRINLNLPNRRLFDTFEARVALAKVFRRHKPKVVIGFGAPASGVRGWRAMT